MRNPQRKNILFFSILSSFLVLFYQFNNTWVAIHENDQVSGCDSFGYARQAQLFRTSNNFVSALDTSINTDIQSKLISWAKTTSLKYKDWYQMIAPHAHHFREDSQKVILQYPPGTGWLLSQFQENKGRKGLWILSFSLISSLFLSRLNISSNSFTNLSISLSCLGSLYITNTFSTRSDSIAPSCVIAILMTSLAVRSINYLNKNFRIPVLEIILISLLFGFSLSIRPGNLLFLVIPISVYLVSFKLQVKYMIRSIILSSSSFFVSLQPLLLANKINTGSFLSSTYSSIDTTFNFSSFFSNLLLKNESIDDSIRFILVLIISLIFSYRAWVYKDDSKFLTSRKIFIFCSWIFMMLMIILMSLKPVFNLYYLAPQLVLTTSISSMSILISRSSRTSTSFSIDRLRILAIISSIIIFVFGYLFIKPAFSEPLTYLNKLPKNSIVWADGVGSELFYYHNINTAKLNFGSEDAQKELVKYLSNNSINQFVLDDANQINDFNLVSSGSLEEYLKYKGLSLFKYIPNNK